MIILKYNSLIQREKLPPLTNPFDIVCVMCYLEQTYQKLIIFYGIKIFEDIQLFNG